MRTTRLLPGVLAGLVLAALPSAIAEAQTPRCAVLALPCKLSVGLDDAQVINPVVAPNGERVVFTHKTISGPDELFSAPIHGGAPPVPLSPTGEFAHFRAISPDGRRVLYTQFIAGGTKLFSVPIAGPASARVRLADDVGVQPQIVISPDSQKVVFLPPTRDRLRVVPIAGPANAGARLTDPFVPGATAGGARISADSRSVVYRADQETAGVFQLYRVPLTLSPAPDPPTTRLNGPLVAGGDVFEFRLAPDNGPVIYRADQDTDNVRELYRVRVGGADNVKLNLPLQPGWEVRPPGELGSDGPAGVTPDGSRILFEIAFVVPGWAFSELYSAPAGGSGAAVRIDQSPLEEPVLTAIANYKVSADSQRVVYTLATKKPGDSQELTWLISAPIAGPASAGAVLTFPQPDDFVYEISRDSRHVGYLLGGGLFGAPILGGTSVRLDADEIPGGFLRAGADRLVYEADVGLREALFSVPAYGSGSPRDLTASLGDRAIISRQALTTDGSTIVYTVLRDGELALYSSRLAP